MRPIWFIQTLAVLGLICILSQPSLGQTAPTNECEGKSEGVAVGCSKSGFLKVCSETARGIFVPIETGKKCEVKPPEDCNAMRKRFNDMRTAWNTRCPVGVQLPLSQKYQCDLDKEKIIAYRDSVKKKCP
jgi:hypothetical protein